MFFSDSFLVRLYYCEWFFMQGCLSVRFSSIYSCSPVMLYSSESIFMYCCSPVRWSSVDIIIRCGCLPMSLSFSLGRLSVQLSSMGVLLPAKLL